MQHPGQTRLRGQRGETVGQLEASGCGKSKQRRLALVLAAVVQALGASPRQLFHQTVLAVPPRGTNADGHGAHHSHSLLGKLLLAVSCL